MNGLLKIGKGRISGCSVRGNDIIVIISYGGALRKYISVERSHRLRNSKLCKRQV